MAKHHLHHQRTKKLLGGWVVVLLMLCACAPVTALPEPPQVPQGLSGIQLDAAAANLALTRADLPAGFQLAAEQSAGPEYVALYLRPTALDAEASGGNFLLSVLTSVGVYTTTAEAETIYAQVSADPTGQAIEDITMVSNAATDIVTAPFEGAAQGADAAEAYRVTFRLMGQNVYEYGHRLRLGNVLVYVVVAAIGNPDEPLHLLEDARDLVQRQIDHIAEIAGQNAPE